jgi:hypothetical protein
MGSFASSLHVKSGDANRVASQLTEILLDGGWRPTAATPDKRKDWPGPSTLRGLHVSAPRDGWVSVLDSDLGGAHSLAGDLAESLKTYAIFVLVNDSDSWSYLMADPSGGVSEFDSGEEADEDDFDGGDLVEAGAAINQLQSLMRDGSVLQRFQEMQAKIMAAAPPEIRAAETRIKTGQGTAADMHQYQAWAMGEMPKHAAEMRQMLAGALNPLKAISAAGGARRKQRKLTKAERAAARERLGKLHPILADGVSDEDVQSVLDKRTTFAEDVLGEFLRLVGINDYYANLGYQYLDEMKPAQLAAHDIRFAQHLRFERST